MNKRAVALVAILTSFVFARAFTEEKLFCNPNFCKRYTSFKQFVSDCLHDPLNNKKVDRLHAENEALQKEIRDLNMQEDETKQKDVFAVEPVTKHSFGRGLTICTATVLAMLVINTAIKK